MDLLFFLLDYYVYWLQLLLFFEQTFVAKVHLRNFVQTSGHAGHYGRNHPIWNPHVEVHGALSRMYMNPGIHLRTRELLYVQLMLMRARRQKPAPLCLKHKKYEVY